MSRRNLRVTSATVAPQTTVVQPIITGDISRFRAKTYDSKLKKVMSEQWDEFAAYPEEVQNVFINFIAGLPDPESLTMIDVSDNETIVSWINYIFQKEASLVQTRIIDFVTRYRGNWGSQLNLYADETEITTWLNALYGAEAIHSKPMVTRFIQGIRSIYANPYIDINDDNDIIELVNLIRQTQEQNPSLDFATVINAIMTSVIEIYKSGDTFIWSIPPMIKFEEKMQENIKKEFATLEGIELFITDASGKRVKMACRDCGKTSWVVPARMHRGRGDEIMHVKAICKECGRPTKNV